MRCRKDPDVPLPIKGEIRISSLRFGAQLRVRTPLPVPSLRTRHGAIDDKQSALLALFLSAFPLCKSIAESAVTQKIGIYTAYFMNELLHFPTTPSGRAHFSPDGSYLLLDHVNSFLLYDAATGERIRRFERFSTDSSWFPNLNQPVFSPDGTHVAGLWGQLQRTGTERVNNRIVIWDVETGKIIKTFVSPAEDARILSLAYSPDGKRLVTGHVNE